MKTVTMRTEAEILCIEAENIVNGGGNTINGGEIL